MIENPKSFFIHKSNKERMFSSIGFNCDCVNGYCCYGIDDNGVEMQMCKSGLPFELDYLEELRYRAAEFNKQNKDND